MELGDISEKYESGGRGVKSISSGKSDPGGVSYGKHQLSTNAGTMHRFLRSPEGLPYAAKLGDLKPGTLAFNKAYLAIVAKDEAAFGKAQRDFITRTHYLPRAKVAGELGFRMKSTGVQEAIYSASVQHGGVEKIMRKAAAAPGFKALSAQAQLEIFYRVREDYATKGVPQLARQLSSRYKRELADVLAIA